MSARLIDLHCDWILQYANESTTFDPSLYEIADSVFDQADGYLQSTSASILACFRTAEDWASQADPWLALAQLITRIEAEFSGRLLIDVSDFARWRAEAHGLCWGMIGIEGFDALIRTTRDLDRLARLFDRGVRVFQPVYSGSNELAGSNAPGDERGLLDPGRDFLETLARLGSGGIRPILDLAHLNPTAMSEILGWFEEDLGRRDRVIPVYSHGALKHPGFAAPRAITVENLRRLRALGGFVGFSVSPPFYWSASVLKAGIELAAELPFLGRAGFEGIAIGTDFLGVDQTLPGLSNAAQLTKWVTSAFDPATSRAILQGNAQTLIREALGVSASS